MDFDQITLKLAVGRLMMQVEEERRSRENAIKGRIIWLPKPEIPTAAEIDKRVLELTEDIR